MDENSELAGAFSPSWVSILCKASWPDFRRNEELYSIHSIDKPQEALPPQFDLLQNMSTEEARKFMRQDASHWYGVGTVFVIGGWVLFRGLHRLCRFVASVVTCFCLKYLVYPTLLGGYGHKMTWMEGIILACFIGLNAFCIGFHTTSIKEWSSRSGALAMINLIPLLTGTRFSLAADTLGFSLRTQASLHKWLGLIATCEAIIHSVASFLPLAWDRAQVWGTIVSVTLHF